MHVLRRTLCGLAAIVSLAALPSVASATDGSYTSTTWTSPTISAARELMHSGIITPPADVPANATITSISGTFFWNQQPDFGSRSESLLCDFADGEYNVGSVFFRGTGCTGFGQTTTNQWTVTGNTAFAGKPAATTRIYLVAQFNDFSTSTIHALIRPSRVLTSRTLTVNYTY